MNDFARVWRGWENKVVDMDVVEEFDSRQDKPFFFKVMLGKVQKHIWTCTVPEAFPGVNGGQLAVKISPSWFPQRRVQSRR